MSLEYSICPKSTVYVLRVRFMFQEHTVYLCPQFMSTVCVPRVQFITVYVLEYSLCPKSTVMSKSTVFVLRIQFMSQCLCPQFMSKNTVYSLCQEYS